MSLEALFMPYVERFDIDIRMMPMKSDSFMTVYDGQTLLSIRDDLPAVEAVQACGLQIARLVLGHSCIRSGLTDARLERREWQDSLRWLANYLIPDRLLSRASRGEWESWQLAEEAGVTEMLAWVRFLHWKAAQGEVVMFKLRKAAKESPFF